MIDRDIHCKMWRGLRNGITPQYKLDSNGKNQYNIVASVTIKEGVSPVEYKVLKIATTAPVFMKSSSIYYNVQWIASLYICRVIHLCTADIEVKLQNFNDYLTPIKTRVQPNRTSNNTLLQRLSYVQIRYTMVSEIGVL